MKLNFGNFNYRVFLINFYSEFAGPCIEKKGFQIFCTMDEREFLTQLDEYDVAWIVSDNAEPSCCDFVSKVVEFNKRGHGVCFWGDNTPWFGTINPVLNSMFGVIIKNIYSDSHFL